MKKYYSPLAILMALSMATPVFATSLGELFDGATLTVGDKIFSNWGLDFNDFGNDIYNIEVEPINIDPLYPGIRYVANSELEVDGGEGGTTNNFHFHYNIATISGLPLIKDNSLEIIDYDFFDEGGGRIDIEEAVYGATVDDSKEVYIEGNYEEDSGDLYSLLGFAPVSTLTINTYISVEAFEDFSNIINIVRLNEFEQIFSQNPPPEPIPEPTTMLLLGTGLVGVAGAARKKKKNQV